MADKDLKKSDKMKKNSGINFSNDRFSNFMVLIGCALICFTGACSISSFYHLFYKFIDDFSQRKDLFLMIFLITSSVSIVTGPLSSFLVNQFGCRIISILGCILIGTCLLASTFATDLLTFSLTYGLGSAFGFGLIFLPAITSVVSHFDNYRPLATGIVFSTIGLGAIAGNFTEDLVELFNWSTVIYSLAMINFLCAVDSIFFRTVQPPQIFERTTDNEEPQTKNQSSNATNKTFSVMFSLLKHPVFLLFSLSFFIFQSFYVFPIIFIKSLSSYGPSKTLTGRDFEVSISASRFLGSIIFGIICTNKKVNRLWIYNISIILCGIATGLSIFCDSVYTFGAFSLIYGITCGCHEALGSVLLVDFFGIKKFINSLGVLLFFEGAASLVRYYLAVYVIEVSSDHYLWLPSILGTASLLIFSGIILFAIPVLQRKQKQKQKQIESNNKETMLPL